MLDRVRTNAFILEELIVVKRVSSVASKIILDQDLQEDGRIRRSSACKQKLKAIYHEERLLEHK